MLLYIVKCCYILLKKSTPSVPKEEVLDVNRYFKT